jgi:hypothetical protein
MLHTRMILVGLHSLVSLFDLNGLARCRHWSIKKPIETGSTNCSKDLCLLENVILSGHLLGDGLDNRIGRWLRDGRTGGERHDFGCVYGRVALITIWKTMDNVPWVHDFMLFLYNGRITTMERISQSYGSWLQQIICYYLYLCYLSIK